MDDFNLTPGQPKGSETILSEEIWEKILMKLTEPSDVLNAGKTCVQFQRILCFKIVDAKALPFLIKYMDGKSVLKCRTVSKGWRDIVGNFFEKYFLGRCVRDYSPLAPFPVTRMSRALYRYFRNGDCQRFMMEMKNHPRNPFIGRAVSFEVGRENYRHEDFHTIYKFFEMFGKHIWTLELNILFATLNAFEGEHILLFIIRDVFELAPNLKKFNIIGISPPVSMNEIRALPPLPAALDKLEFSGVFARYPKCKVIKAILLHHSNSQLRVLHINTLDPLQNLNWPNLRELHFTEHINELDVIFRNLRLPKLELLSIALIAKEKKRWWWERGHKNAFKKFFQALHHLTTSSPNLKTLRFDNNCFWGKGTDQQRFPRGLFCPENIKTLKISEDTILSDFIHGTSDYSFLLRFPHVENIHVNKHVVRRSPVSAGIDGEIVQVHKFMYSGRMYESNIWKLLPKLKVLSYRERVYTRSSYERRLAK